MKRTQLVWFVAITAFICFFAIQDLQAVIAYPYPIQYRQPDGTTITVRLKGDERLSWAETTDGYTLLNNGKKGWEYAFLDGNQDMFPSGKMAHNPGFRDSNEEFFLTGITRNVNFSQRQIEKANVSLKSASSIAGFIPTGSKKLLMILIQYPDKPFTFSQSNFSDLMNTPNYSGNGAYGSVKDYFLENSYGMFDLTTDVAPHIYTSLYNMAYYGEDVGNNHSPKAGELIREAVLAADADGVDFTQYDNDNDGKVDGIYVIYAGYGQATGGGTETIWPHAGAISGVTCDGKAITSYSCSNELTYGTDAITTIGVICHEFGHVCGSPDYYDTNYETDGEYPGTGDWDLMCSGCYNGPISGNHPSHLNAFEKVRVGWVSPVTLTGTSSVTMPDITFNQSVYIYNTTTANEYFIMENRQNAGFNTFCPGHGLLIYHYSKTNWDLHKNRTHPQGFYPVVASSSSNPTANPDDYGNVNSQGCPFPGSSGIRGFYDSGMPSSKSWAGANTNLPITQITESSGVISFNITQSVTCGTAPTSQATSFNTSSSLASALNVGWTRGNGNKVLVVAREGSPVDFDPMPGNSYSANAVYKSGDELGAGNYVVYDGTATSFTMTGVSGGQQYYFAVYEYNSATYCYKTPAMTGNGTVSCNYNPLTFYEEFENSGWGCWTVTDNTGEGNWKLGTTSTVNYTPGLTGNYAYFKCQYGSAHNYSADLISPAFNLSGYRNADLQFTHLFDGSSYYPSSGTVFYSIDNGTTWVQIAQYTTDEVDETVSLSVSAAARQSQVKFKWSYTCSPTGAYMWAVDDIRVVDNSVLWTGNTDTDWFKAGNWSNSAIPTSAASVVIPTGVPNQPQINASGAVCKSITLESGATLTMNGSTSYTLTVSGNWVNNGTFTPGMGIVDFNGASDLQTISGSSATNFYRLSVSLGQLSRILEAVSPITFSGASNQLFIYSGTFKLSSASSLSSVTLSSGTGFWNNGGTLSANVATWFVDNGLLRISAGIVNIGTSINNSIVYLNGGKIIIEGGTLNVAGRICPNSGTSTGVYTQTGGTVNLMTAGSNSTTRAAFELNSGVPFTMSGGSIVVQKNSSHTSSDVIISSTSSSVTGGTLEIGNASTSGSPVIRVNSTAPFYNLLVNGTGNPTAKLVTNNLTVKNNVTVNSGGTLDGNGLTLTAGGDWTNNGTFTHNNGAVVFNGTNPQLISGNAESVFNNLTVGSGGAVTSIASGAKVTVSGALVTNNLLAINSEMTGAALQPSGSLIYSGSGTPSGTVTYNRRFITFPEGSGSTDYDWHYFSSPVEGQAISGFNADKVTAIWEWSEHNATPWQTISSGNFESGRGYNLDQSATSDGMLPFTGSIATTVSPRVATAPYNTYSTDYTNDRGTWGGGGWNLLGNPFTSAMDASAFVTANAASFDPSYQAVYIYDGSSGVSGNYYVISGGAYTDPFGYGDFTSTAIQAGQGFFVLAKQNGVQFTFNRSWQVHGTTVPLKSAELDSPWAGVRLNVRKEQGESSTTILYREGMTAGLDPGYDLGLLSTQPVVEVYTALVRNNGVNFIRQALPLSRPERNVVPVGIDCEQGGQVTFSADILPLAGFHFMLEDRENGKWTNLEESSYTTVLKSNTSGTGRFYLQVVPVSTALMPEPGKNNGIVVWTSGAEIHLSGNFGTRASASVFDLSGRKILETQLTGSASNILNMPSGARGVYLVKVTDGGKIKTEKVVF